MISDARPKGLRDNVFLNKTNNILPKASVGKKHIIILNESLLFHTIIESYSE